jgi:hypothetical protein
MHTRRCLSLDFSHKGFYKRDKEDIYYDDSISPNLSHGIIGVFLSIQDQSPSVFPQGLRIMHDDQALTVQEGVLQSKLIIELITSGQLKEYTGIISSNGMNVLAKRSL